MDEEIFQKAIELKNSISYVQGIIREMTKNNAKIVIYNGIDNHIHVDSALTPILKNAMEKELARLDIEFKNL